MNEKPNKHIIDILFVIALFALFVLSALFLISIGAGIYSKTMTNMDHNFNSRTAVAYINEKVRQADLDGSVSSGLIDGNDAIVITSNISGKDYITYIYEYEGKLMELMERPELNLGASAGQLILNVQNFEIEKINENLLRVCLVTEGDESYSFNLSIHSGGDSYDG